MSHPLSRQILPLVMVLALAGCNKLAAEEGKPKSTAAPVPVTVAVVRQAPEATMVRGTGTVAFKREIPLSFKVAGKVDGFQVDLSDPVTAGQKLARIQVAEIDAQLRGAEARVTRARQDLDRLQPLLAKGFVERGRVETAKSALDSAMAERDAIAFNRGLSEIISPADGVVLARPLEPGQIVPSGTTALVIGDRESGVIVRVGLSDRDVTKLDVGGAAEVVVDDGMLPARVTRIAAKSAAGTGVFDVELTVDKPPLYLSSGRIVNVRITPRPSGSNPPLAIPASAVIEGFGDVAILYVVNADGQSVVRRQVKVAGLQGADLLITTGLTVGERVVATGGAYLRPDSVIAISAAGN